MQADDKEVLDFFNQLKGVMGGVSSATTSLQSHSKALKNAQNDLFDATGKTTGELKKAKDAYTVLMKKEMAYKAELSKLDKVVKKQYNSTQDLSKAYGTIKKSISGTIGSVAKLATALGISGISLNSIVKTGMEYRQSLLAVSRAQQVAGKGASDLTAVLNGVTKQTSLAKVEFISFAKEAQSGFVGLKPSMENIVLMAETIGKQIGPGLDQARESFSKLKTVQSGIPGMYDQIAEGAAIVKKVREGTSTASEEQHLASLKNTVLTYSSIKGISQEAMETQLQLLTPLVGKQNEYIDVLTAQQQAQAAMKNATVELYATMEPLITGVAKQMTKVVNIILRYRESAIAVAVGFAAWKVIAPMVGAISVAIRFAKLSQDKFNASVKANPYVAIASLVIAAITLMAAGIGYLYSRQRKANEEAAKYRKLQEQTGKMTADRNRLLTDQKKIYDDIWKAGKKEGQSLEERATLHKEGMAAAKKKTDSAGKLIINFNKVKATMEAELGIIEDITGSLKTQVAISEEFGLVNEKALKGMIQNAKEYSVEIDKGLKSKIDIIKSQLGNDSPDIELNLSGNVLEQAQQTIDALNKQKISLEPDSSATDKEKEASLKKSEGIRAKVAFLQTMINKSVTAEGAQTKANLGYVMANVKQQEKFTSAYENRLNIERQLMESAQFGLGASVEMMQKQVDLAEQLAQTYRKADEQLANQLVSKGKANEMDIEALKNAKTQGEAEDYIKNTMKKEGQVAQELSNFAFKHQEISGKILQQQKKIYDLTKNVREGYLDSIREMASGAGEFSKIIGTQEMGVTQLMSGVKKVTGLAKLNTMALGGLQEKVLTASGIGTQVGYKYGTGGLENSRSKDEEAGMLGRIYNYKKSTDEAKKAMKGENTGAKVGTAVAASEKDIGALKEAVQDGGKEGVKEGVLEAAKILSKRNGSRDFMGGFMGDTSNLPAKGGSRSNHISNLTTFGSGFAKGSRGQVADPTGGPTLAKGSVGVAEHSDWQRNFNKTQRIQKNKRRQFDKESSQRQFDLKEAKEGRYKGIARKDGEAMKMLVADSSSSNKEEPKDKALSDAQKGIYKGVKYSGNKAMDKLRKEGSTRHNNKSGKGYAAARAGYFKGVKYSGSEETSNMTGKDYQRNEAMDKFTEANQASNKGNPVQPQTVGSKRMSSGSTFRIQSMAKEMSAGAKSAKGRKGRTESDARRREITGDIARETDFSDISNKQYAELKQARTIASKHKLENANPVFKGGTVERTGSRSAEQKKYATDVQQANATTIKATQGAAMYGMGGDAIGSTEGGVSNATLEQMADSLLKIEASLANQLSVKVEV